MKFKMSQLSKILFSTCGIFLFLACFSTAQAITLSPAKIEITGDPGTTVASEFTIINEQEKEITFYTSSENFEAQGETGAPKFTDGKTDLASWIKTESSVTLQKGEQKVVPFTMTIPVGADAGGHFAAIFLSTTPAITNAGEVSVGAKTGVLVLLRGSGHVAEEGVISDFKTSSNSRFASSLPILFEYRFHNGGGDRIKPEGTLAIKNILGWSKINLAANPTHGNILPGSTRKFEVVWGDKEEMSLKPNFFGKVWYELTHFAFGVYKANLHVEYGDKNTAAAASYVITVIPWHLLLLLVAILIIGGFLILTLLKKYNRWIIKQARMNK